MKTNDMKKYIAPQMEVVLIQSQCSLLAGSNYSTDINGRDDNNGNLYEIGDED